MAEKDKISVCVFGSSSTKTPEIFLKVGYALGALLAEKRFPCVNGGGKFGVMGAVNRGIIDSNGVAIGVIHSKWVVDVDEMQHGMTKMIVADGDNLVERKRLLLDNSDCFICLPGGPGTYDELHEVMCEKQLGFHNKPIVIVNVDNFFDGTIAQLNAAKDNSLLHLDIKDIVHVCSSIEEAVAYCERECRHRVTVFPKVIQEKVGQEKSLPILGKSFSTGLITGAIIAYMFVKVTARL